MLCKGWYILVISIAAIALFISSVIIYKHLNNGNLGLLICGWIFTAVALYRAIFPSMYENRAVWHETPANSTQVIRMLALVAEICMAILMFGAYRFMGNKSVLVTIFLVLVIVAQIPATLGAYTSYGWLYAIEETIWTVAAIILFISTVGMVNTNFSIVMVISLSIYLIFQAIAVPKRWSKKLDKLSKRSWCSYDNIQRDCEKYGPIFLIWHTGYFVLLNILVVYLQLVIC